MSRVSALSELRRTDDAAPTTPAVPMPAAKRGTRLVVPLVILFGFAGLVLFAARDALRPRREVRVVPVVARAGASGTPAAQGVTVATAAGWIEPAPFPVHVSALSDGIVEEVLVLEGDRVEAGQVVARLVADDARLGVQGAEAELGLAVAKESTARAVLAAASTDWENPVALEESVKVSRAKLDEARAERVALDREKDVQDARLAELEDRRKREEVSVASGAVSAADLARTELQIATQEAAIALVAARIPVLDARIETMAAHSKRATEDLRLRVDDRLALDDARASAERAAADVARARAALGEAELRLGRMQVRAPSAGIVMRRLAEPGGKLMLQMDGAESSWAVDLYDPAELQVRVDVPLADAGGVGVGQKATVVVETLPDRVFPGEVTRLVHYADVQKNTVEVKVRLLETAPELKPEMLARVEIIGDGGDGGPATAEGGRLFAPERLVRGGVAWIVGEGGDRAAKRTIVLGRGRSSGWVEVASGLRLGDRLIDVEASTLSEGDSIRVSGESAPDGKSR